MRWAREVLRHGTRHALGVESSRGEQGGTTCRALAALGFWDELSSLPSSSLLPSLWSSDLSVLRSLLSDPRLSVPSLLALLTQAAPSLYLPLLDSLAARLSRSPARRPDVLLLLAFAHDRRLAPGPLLARAAALALIEQHRWSEALPVLAPHAASLDHASAARWLCLCPAPLRPALAAMLGPRQGRMAGAQAAADSAHCVSLLLSVPADHLPTAVSECLQCLPLVLAPDALAATALSVVDWALSRGVAVAPLAVGRVCLSLARVPDVAGIGALLARVVQPDEVCYGALVNCYAALSDFARAREVIERMAAAGVAPSYLTFRYLLDRLEGTPEALDVWARAAELVKLPVTAVNRYLRELLRFGHHARALALFEERIVEPDVVTYTTLIVGLSDLDRPADALRVAQELVADARVTANDHAFTALRSLCRAHGLERQFPGFRAWAASHGVKVGSIAASWRPDELASTNEATLMFPR